MRKSVIAVTVALVGMMVAAPMASAGQWVGDTKKACADIVDGRVNYQSLPLGDPAPTGAEVIGQVDLGGKACNNVTYTMTVYSGDTATGTPTTTTGVAVAATATDPPRVNFSTPVTLVSATTDTVCVAFDTSTSKGVVLDPAPDTGCFAYIINSDTSGSTKFR